MNPYENWEKFREEARRLWIIYQKTTLPQNITRIAVRFINRFDFPGTTIELGDYLKIFPHVPDSCLMKSFSMQAIFNQDDINSTLIVTQALIPSVMPHTISILLDFDLFNEELRSCESDFWSFLEEMRKRLKSPYLEHTAQSFARFFMRVGLPSSIEPFK